MTRQVTTLPVSEKTVASGNWDTSRATIDRVIIHTMVGTADAANARFNNSTQQVSAHYGVRLDGSIWHWVDEDNTAYHAGNYVMNQRSIGIEHEDNGDYNGTRPDSLYTTSAKLVKDICAFYNIPIDRQHVLKHSEIIPTGCPDALDIDRIVKQAQDAGIPMATISQKELDQLRFDRDQNYTNWQQEKEVNKQLQIQLDEMTKKNQDLQVGISNLQTKIDSLTKQIEDLTKSNEELKTQNSTLQKQVSDLLKSQTGTNSPSNNGQTSSDVPSQTANRGITDTSVGIFFKTLLAWLRGK